MLYLVFIFKMKILVIVPKPMFLQYISCHQIKLSVPEAGYIQLSSWPKFLPWEPLKQLRVLPKLLIPLHKLLVRPYC